jgi:sec-independent protein translocase protein TatA
MTPGPLQIILVILVIVLLFGASRVPGIAENLAKGINSFKKGLKDEGDDLPEKISKSEKSKTKDE